MVNKIAAVLYFVHIVGVPIMLLLIRHLILYRQVPVVFGVRVMGDGFIERWGVNRWGVSALIAVSFVNLAFSVLNPLTGYLLWRQMRIGGILALLLFPIELFLSIGQMAPLEIPLVVVRIVLVIVGWGLLK